jgi:hypothetical protein
LPTKFHEKVLRTETANKDMSKLWRGTRLC